MGARPTQSVWNNQTSTYSYDAASRMTSYTAPGSRSYTNTFDAADRLVQTSLPSTVDVNWQYDAIYRPTNLIYTQPDEGILSRKIPLNLSDFNRINLGYTLNKGKIALLREKYGEHSEIVWAESVNTSNQYMKQLLDPITIASFSYTFNAVSRVTQVNQSINQVNKTYTYTRDNEDQVLSATTPDATYTYSFDERNNRLSQRIVTISSDTTDTYVYNIADQLVSREKRHTANQQLIESFSYTYDSLGRLTQQTKTSVTPNEVTEYQYYVGGNLKKVILPDETEISFQYDAMGNRVKKTTDEEIISYQYAMGTLRKEIHQDKTTEAVLYYLLYCPWGFEKVIPASGENPAVVTPYYYVFDQAGLVKAITDDEGDILESYEYSPYGELLTTPTISQYRFVSGREECIWDPETKLYYMHARYYDAVTGRFLSKDSVRGSLTAPISLNRYTYCQNDPITLADPSGNSPFNTGLPGRKGDPGDQIEENLNVGDSCVPELASSDLGLIPNPLNHQNDQCYLAYMNQYGEISITLNLPNGGRVRIVLGRGHFDQDKGVVFTQRYSPDDMIITGDARAVFTNMLLDDFIKGIREGLKALFNEGISDYSSIHEALSNANSMIEAGYFDSFKNISPGTDENDATSFMKHAIIGGYIASKMLNFGLEEEDQVNRIFGLWVSFWAERAQIWYGASHKIPIKSTPNELGLVDIANFCKVLAIAEHGGGEIKYDLFTTKNTDYMNVKSGLEGYDADDDGDIEGGILVGDPEWWLFNGGNGTNKMNYENITYKGNLFINISLGVGILFNKIRTATPSSIGFHTSISLYDWLVAGRAYNGDTRDIGTETYNHGKKLVTLLRKLYGTSWNNQILNDFLKRLDKLAEENKKNGNILSKDIFYPYP